MSGRPIAGFIVEVARLFVLLCGLLAFAMTLAAGFGAFGWPTDPRWLIVTVPIALLAAACIVVAFLRLAKRWWE